MQPCSCCLQPLPCAAAQQWPATPCLSVSSRTGTGPSPCSSSRRPPASAPQARYHGTPTSPQHRCRRGPTPLKPPTPPKLVTITSRSVLPLQNGASRVCKLHCPPCLDHGRPGILQGGLQASAPASRASAVHFTMMCCREQSAGRHIIQVRIQLSASWWAGQCGWITPCQRCCRAACRVPAFGVSWLTQHAREGRCSRQASMRPATCSGLLQNRAARSNRAASSSGLECSCSAAPGWPAGVA